MAILITGTISSIVRLRNSQSASPRFRVALTTGEVFETQPDSQVNYALTQQFVGRKVDIVTVLGKITELSLT